MSKPEKVVITVRLSEPTIARLDAMAAKCGVSRPVFLNTLINSAHDQGLPPALEMLAETNGND